MIDVGFSEAPPEKEGLMLAKDGRWPKIVVEMNSELVFKLLYRPQHGTDGQLEPVVTDM